MKKHIIIALVGFLFSLPFVSNAQCTSFSKESCKPLLTPYIHDGIYNAAVVAEGETVEMYKTFYSGQEYRLVVCAEESLPKVQFQVLDSDRNILFDNSEKDFVNVWDFNLTSSQMLTISIKVESAEEMLDDIAQGCLSVLVGFKEVDDSAKENTEENKQ